MAILRATWFQSIPRRNFDRQMWISGCKWMVSIFFDVDTTLITTHLIVVITETFLKYKFVRHSIRGEKPFSGDKRLAPNISQFPRVVPPATYAMTRVKNMHWESCHNVDGFCSLALQCLLLICKHLKILETERLWFFLNASKYHPFRIQLCCRTRSSPDAVNSI